jgi:hypothetical protein
VTVPLFLGHIASTFSLVAARSLLLTGCMLMVVVPEVL